MARVKASVRKATATVHQGGKAKFPIPDEGYHSVPWPLV